MGVVLWKDSGFGNFWSTMFWGIILSMGCQRRLQRNKPGCETKATEKRKAKKSYIPLSGLSFLDFLSHHRRLVTVNSPDAHENEPESSSFQSNLCGSLPPLGWSQCRS